MNKPQLRLDIQLVPAEVEGRQMVVFIDPLGITEQRVAVDMSLVPLLELLDGSHDVSDIQMIMMRQHGGQIPPLAELEAFINGLDMAFLLNSDRFRSKMNALYETFAGEKDRPPSHAGRSYDADPRTLTQYIENAEARLTADESTGRDGMVTGLLAPHIDIQVAGTRYVSLYRQIKNRAYDLVIIFGINHQWQDGLYCVTEKNYITPFGTMETDRKFIRDLSRRLPAGTIATNDFGHKMEHSIEFQTVFLHYYLESPVPIVPILCGSIHEFIYRKKNLFDDVRFTGMVNAIEELITAGNRRVLFVAGVDFSHVGLKFGSDRPANTILPDASANDRKILSWLEEGNPEAIFENALETGDQFNVCGLPSMLIFSRLMKGSTGTLLSYDTYDEKATESAVTYASMRFTEA